MYSDIYICSGNKVFICFLSRLLFDLFVYSSELCISWCVHCVYLGRYLFSHWLAKHIQHTFFGSVIKMYAIRMYMFVGGGYGNQSFTVSLYSPNDRHLHAVRAVQGDYQWLLKNGENSHRPGEPTMHCDTKQYQPVIRLINHIRVMPANWRLYLIPQWQL